MGWERPKKLNLRSSWEGIAALPSQFPKELLGRLPTFVKESKDGEWTQKQKDRTPTFCTYIPVHRYHCNFLRHPRYKASKKMNPYAKMYLDLTEKYFDYVPAVLSEEAALKDFVKYFKEHREPNEFIHLGKVMTHRYLKRYIKDWKPIPYLEAIQHLDYSTSPGFPWNQKFDKRTLVNEPKFIEYFNKYFTSLETDDPLYVLFNMSLKEELRPKEKVEEMKTRTICAAPVEHTIGCIMMFKGFMDQFLHWNIEMRHLGGFTHFYGGWDYLIKKLKRYEKCNGYDFSQYDSSIRDFFFDGFSEFFLQYFSDPKEKMIIKNLITQACQSLIILPDGSVVDKDFGNATGWYFTFVFNVYVNMVLNFGFYIKQFESMSVRDYEKHLEQFFCGDDNATSWEDPRFDPEKFVEFASSVGMTCNLDNKSPVKPEELVFVSRHTIRFRDMWVSYGNPEKMLGAMVNCFEHDDYASVIIKLCAIRREMYFHKEFYKQITGFIQFLLNYFSPLKTQPEYKLALTNFEPEHDLIFLHTGYFL